MPPGSAAPTRTPTASCASTCPRAPTCRCSRRPNSTPSPPGSTVGRARRLASRPPTKCSPAWWTRRRTSSRHEIRRVFATDLESAKGITIAVAVAGLLLGICLVAYYGFGAVTAALLAVGWGGFAVLVCYHLGLYGLLGVAWFAILPHRSRRALAACLWGRMVRD